MPEVVKLLYFTRSIPVEFELGTQFQNLKRARLLKQYDLFRASGHRGEHAGCMDTERGQG
jgi:hypothetical protein